MGYEMQLGFNFQIHFAKFLFEQFITEVNSPRKLYNLREGEKGKETQPGLGCLSIKISGKGDKFVAHPTKPAKHSCYLFPPSYCFGKHVVLS